MAPRQSTPPVCELVHVKLGIGTQESPIACAAMLERITRTLRHAPCSLSNNRDRTHRQAQPTVQHAYPPTPAHSTVVHSLQNKQPCDAAPTKNHRTATPFMYLYCSHISVHNAQRLCHCSHKVGEAHRDRASRLGRLQKSCRTGLAVQDAHTLPCSQLPPRRSCAPNLSPRRRARAGEQGTPAVPQPASEVCRT